MMRTIRCSTAVLAIVLAAGLYIDWRRGRWERELNEPAVFIEDDIRRNDDGA
jgi:hypothetical protein